MQLFLKPKLPWVLLERTVHEISEAYQLLGFKVEAENLPADYIYVEYKSGYGDSAEDVPEDIRQVIKLLVAYWYEDQSEIAAVSDGFEELLSSYKRISY